MGWIALNPNGFGDIVLSYIVKTQWTQMHQCQPPKLRH